jgi:hypothetical protein
MPQVIRSRAVEASRCFMIADDLLSADMMSASLGKADQRGGKRRRPLITRCRRHDAVPFAQLTSLSAALEDSSKRGRPIESLPRRRLAAASGSRRTRGQPNEGRFRFLRSRRIYEMAQPVLQVE